MLWDAKDPIDVVDYWFNFTPALAADETVTGHEVTVPPGIVKVLDSRTDKKVRVRLSGGTDDTAYDITCVATTSAGQTLRMINTLPVVNRKQIPIS